jgi:putative GTP pyrophosphokinase
VADLRSWYDEKAPIYTLLAQRTEKLIKEILHKEAVTYVLIQSRVKELKSFEEKMLRKKYKDPDEMTDLAGIIIVGSVISDAELISKIIKREKEFKIDWNNSLDPSIRLAEDRVGHRGKNYVATFREDQFKNTEEYEKFKDLRFEIQITTLLDYSWGKIEHDRNYKTAVELPKHSDIPRRFKLAAGALEIIDNEFDRLSKETEQIADPQLYRISRGDLDIQVSPLSLRQFLTLNFSDIPGFREQFLGSTEDLLDELNSMGINTIAKLNEIIRPNVKSFKEKYAEVSKPKDYVSFSALIRDILIINDPEGYFKKAWKHHYNTLDYHCWKVYNKFGVNTSNFSHQDVEFEEGSDSD